MLRDAQNADLRLVDGADAARARRRDHRGAHERGPGARLGRPREGRPDADPRPLRRAGRRRGGLRARRSTTPQQRALRAGVGLSRCPTFQGLTAAEMVDAAYRGGARRLLDRGRQLPRDAARSRPRSPRRSAACATRIHQDIVLTSMMLLRAARTRCCCSRPPRATSRPAAAPRPPPSGASSSRPRCAGRRIGSAKPEWEVFGEVAARVRPELARRVRFASSQAIRDEIARAVPLYAGIERLARAGRPVPVGRPAAVRRRPSSHTPDGKAHFSVRRRRPSGAPRGRVLRLHAPRQAVQLDGAARRRTR